LHYALVTLTQLLRLSADEDGLAPVIIQDYPALSHRGALIDISPLSRIPTLVQYIFYFIIVLSMRVYKDNIFAQICAFQVPGAEDVVSFLHPRIIY
jgi:hypothetical protein